MISARTKIFEAPARADFRNLELSLILSIALVLTLATSLPMMGLLKNEKPNSPILDVEVHSGLWGSIPIHETSSQTFKVENPTEHTLTLELKTLNWTPIMASKDIEVSWDYDGTPLLPGEATARAPGKRRSKWNHHRQMEYTYQLSKIKSIHAQY